MTDKFETTLEDVIEWIGREDEDLPCPECDKNLSQDYVTCAWCTSCGFATHLKLSKIVKLLIQSEELMKGVRELHKIEMEDRKTREWDE